MSRSQPKSSARPAGGSFQAREVYDGSTKLGAVTLHASGFRAAVVGGRVVGFYRTPQEAVRAVVKAAREA